MCVCVYVEYVYLNYILSQLQLALTYASRSGSSVIADRINDIICRRESLPSLSDDEDLSCDEEQDVTEYSLQSSSVASSRQRISSNSFRLLKKLPSNYKSGIYKERTATKNHTYQRDNYDPLSDDSCGTRNDVPTGSHDQEATPIDEGNSTLQLFDDNEDTNSDTQEKTREPVVSKCIKPSLGEIKFIHVCSCLILYSLASQPVKANPFKVVEKEWHHCIILCMC